MDCCNLASAQHGVPAGAFDLGQVIGDIMTGFVSGDEEFTPLGEPSVIEHPSRAK